MQTTDESYLFECGYYATGIQAIAQDEYERKISEEDAEFILSKMALCVNPANPNFALISRTYISDFLDCISESEVMPDNLFLNDQRK